MVKNGPHGHVLSLQERIKETDALCHSLAPSLCRIDVQALGQDLHINIINPSRSLVTNYDAKCLEIFSLDNDGLSC